MIFPAGGGSGPEPYVSGGLGVLGFTVKNQPSPFPLGGLCVEMRHWVPFSLADDLADLRLNVSPPSMDVLFIYNKSGLCVAQQQRPILGKGHRGTGPN